MYPSAKGISLYGKQTGREPNTKKKLVIDPFRCNSDPQTVQLNETDLKSGPDSAILVGESTKGTKLEGAYKKKSTVGANQPHHHYPANRKQQGDNHL